MKLLSKKLVKNTLASFMSIGFISALPSSAATYAYYELQQPSAEQISEANAVGRNYTSGIPKNYQVVFNWYEYQGNGKVVVDCTFTVKNNNGSISPAPASSPSKNDRFRYKDPCGPDNVGNDRSYVHIYVEPIDGSTESQRAPVLLTKVKLNGRSNTKERENFYVLTPYDKDDRGWTISDACRNEQYLIYPDNPDKTNQFNTIDIAQDYPGTTSKGGAVIFPSRAVGNKSGALTLCDSGILRDGGKTHPHYNDVSFTAMEYLSDPELPETNGSNHNKMGVGLKYSVSSSNAKTLSMLSYNLGSIPKGPFKGEVSKRSKKIQEIVNSISDLPDGQKPDVLAFSEVFQDKFAMYGIDMQRWEKNSVRRVIYDTLGNDYSYAQVMPSSAPNNNSRHARPDARNCINANKRITCDTSLYPNCNTDLTIKTCANGQNNALNSGVLVMVKNSTMTVLDEDFQRYKWSDGADRGAAKGVQYVEAQKCSGGSCDTYKIFASHMQASYEECAARVKQIEVLAGFIQEKLSSKNDKVVIAGDLNIDPRGNNHIGDTNIDKAEVCRNEHEQLLMKLSTIVAGNGDRVLAKEVHPSKFSMPYTNDCLVNDSVGKGFRDQCPLETKPAKKSKQLDHILTVGKQPFQAGRTIVRQVSDGTFWKEHTGEDYGGHYPVFSVMDYSADNSTIFDDAYMAHDTNWPIECPYGVLSDDLEVCCADANSCTDSDINTIKQEEIYCNEDNQIAPCIVVPGYQNLAKLPGTNVSATHVSGSVWNPNNLVDGRFQHSGLSDNGSNNVWRTNMHIDVANEQPKAVVALHTPQYVTRVRLRNADIGGYWGIKKYKLEVRRDRQAQWQTIANGATMGTISGGNTADPDAWYMHEFSPLLVGEVRVTCQQAYYNGCSLAEVEIYGGGETTLLDPETLPEFKEIPSISEPTYEEVSWVDATSIIGGTDKTYRNHIAKANEYKTNSNLRITKVELWSGNRVDGVRLIYSDGTNTKLGGKNNNKSKSYNIGGKIKQVQICPGTFKGDRKVFKVKFTTTTNQVIEAGSTRFKVSGKWWNADACVTQNFDTVADGDQISVSGLIAMKGYETDQSVRGIGFYSTTIESRIVTP